MADEWWWYKYVTINLHNTSRQLVVGRPFTTPRAIYMFYPCTYFNIFKLICFSTRFAAIDAK